MKKYSTKTLADLANITVRTLHYYDSINLLKPSFRDKNSYRWYTKKELLLLQQILFYQKLGFNLNNINNIINNTSFDIVEALHSHKKELNHDLKNTQQLLKTIDKTLLELINKKTMNDKEIYNGFTNSKIKTIKKEVIEKWGEDKLYETEERIKKMGKEGWKINKQKGEEITQLLADLMNLKPDNQKVQQAIKLHFEYTNLFYKVSEEIYLGLGKMYIEDQRFTNYYEKFRKGLSQFIHDGIIIFCRNNF